MLSTPIFQDTDVMFSAKFVINIFIKRSSVSIICCSFDNNHSDDQLIYIPVLFVLGIDREAVDGWITTMETP